MKIKICKNCGYEIFPLDTVCEKCGTKVDASFSVSEIPTNESKNSTTNKKEKTNKSTVKTADSKKSNSNASNRAPIVAGNPKPNIYNGTGNRYPQASRPITSPKNASALTPEKQKTDASEIIKKVLIGIGIFIGALLFGLIIFFTVKAVSEAISDSEEITSDETDSSSEGITIPEDMLYELGLDDGDVDSVVSSGLAKNATYNDDGSVTLTMTELQKKAALELIKKEINAELKEYIEEEYYEGVTKISPNKDFTSYMIYTTFTDPDEYDDMLSSDLFDMSSKYAACLGTTLTSIHIDLVNKEKKDIYHSFEYSGDEDIDDEEEEEEEEESDTTPALESAKPADTNTSSDSQNENENTQSEKSTNTGNSSNSTEDPDFDEDDSDDEDEDWEDEDMEDESDDDEDWEDATPDYDDDEDTEEDDSTGDSTEGTGEVIIPMDDQLIL